MKNTLIFVAAMSAGLLFAGENLVKNGNIEELKGNKPLYWSKVGSQALLSAENGNHRLHLKKANDGKTVFCTWQQDVNVTPETEYILSGEMEGEGRLFLYELGEKKKWLKQHRGVSFTKKSEKKKVSFKFKTSKEAKIAQIRFEIYGKNREAEGFLDNVTLETVPAAK